VEPGSKAYPDDAYLTTHEDLAGFLEQERPKMLGLARFLCNRSGLPYDLAPDLVQQLYLRLWSQWVRGTLPGDAPLGLGSRKEHRTSFGHLRRSLQLYLRSLSVNEVRRKLTHPATSLDDLVESGWEPALPADPQEVLALGGAYRRFLAMLEEEAVQTSSNQTYFQALCARLVRIEGYSLERVSRQLEEEAPKLMKGYSTNRRARIDRVRTAVARVDQGFREWFARGMLSQDR
jgi:DNA-directed RNA polymerase specialized sigma24 family protein